MGRVWTDCVGCRRTTHDVTDLVTHGQNAICVLTGSTASAVTFRFAEELDESGLLNLDSGSSEHTHVLQEDRYICNGSGEAGWEPRFTYHGRDWLN